MTAAVVVALALVGAGTALSRFLPRAGRSLLAVLVVALPAAWTVPATIRSEVRDARADARLSPFAKEVEPPVHFPRRYRNVRLLAAARRLVPADATVAFAPGGRFLQGRTRADARRIYVQSGWVRWFAFSLAPRLVVADLEAPWVVVVDQAPRRAGIAPARAWRFGRDWLVEQ